MFYTDSRVKLVLGVGYSSWMNLQSQAVSSIQCPSTYLDIDGTVGFESPQFWFDIDKFLVFLEYKFARNLPKLVSN